MMKITNINTGEIFERTDILKVIVYGRGKILFDGKDRKIEEYHMTEKGIFTNKYMGDVTNIFLSELPKRAIKENLNRKDNYYRTEKGRYSFESGLVVYIHESEIKSEYTGEKLCFETNDQKCYCDSYKLEFIHGYTVNRPHWEKIDAAPGWKIPDGGKWGSGFGTKENPVYDTTTHWKTKETHVVKRWIEVETCYTLDTKSGPYTRIEYSVERIENQKIADAVNAAKCFSREISSYDIERLKKICNISLREEK